MDCQWELFSLSLSPLLSSLQENRSTLGFSEAYEKDFMLKIDGELKKVNDFFLTFSSRLRAKMCAFVQIVNHEHYFTSSADSLECELNEMGSTLVSFDKYTKTNYEGFQQIMKEHDECTGSKVSQWFLFRLKEQPFARRSSLQFSSLILKYSQCCSGYRHVTGKCSKKGEESEGTFPTDQTPIRRKVMKIVASQERNDSFLKFWVRPEYVMTVKVAILKHLPIFPTLPPKANEEGRDSIQISTCYYVDRQGISPSVRFRVYEQGKVVYVDFTGKGRESADSLEIVSIPSHHLYDYTQGTFTVEMYRTHLTSRGVSVFDIEESVSLFQRIQKHILEHNLKPLLTSKYTRTYFQGGGVTGVSIALDEDMYFIKEHMKFTKAPPRWHRDYDNVTDSDIHRFPFAVLTIRMSPDVREGRSEWIERLAALPFLEKAHTFSKYTHGCSVLHPSILSASSPYEKKRDAQDGSRAISSGRENSIGRIESVSRPPSIVTRLRKFFGVDVVTPPPSAELKIEPKTFFANERTFMQWASFCVTLQSIGVAFVSFGNQKVAYSESWVAVAGGEVYLAIAFVFLLYSLVKYRSRATSIRLQQYGNYDDAIGPFLLVIVLSASCVLHLYLSAVTPHVAKS